jgi:carbamoyl-phosphate synthase large subunit
MTIARAGRRAQIHVRDPYPAGSRTRFWWTVHARHRAGGGLLSTARTVVLPASWSTSRRAGVPLRRLHRGLTAIQPRPGRSRTVTEGSERIALGLGTRGIVNIQYLVYSGALYVIEVNPRASRTVPYISKVTDIPMVELASRVMLGEKLKDLGYADGHCPSGPRNAVNVPGFSFGEESATRTASSARR